MQLRRHVSERAEMLPIGTTGFHYCATPISGTSGYDKPGFCPAVPPGTAGICITGCTNDQSCAGNNKCCSNGCGRVCTAPAATGGTGTKPGSCPYNNAAAFCGSTPRYCNSDANCGGSAKCCLHNCSFQCMNPIGGTSGGTSSSKPGYCPVMTPYQGGCTNQCVNDQNCYGQQKCCRNNCANVCVNPSYNGK